MLTDRQTDQFETRLGVDRSTVSSSHKRHAQVLSQLERVWISELIADDNDDPNVDDVEKYFS